MAQFFLSFCKKNVKNGDIFFQLSFADKFVIKY